MVVLSLSLLCVTVAADAAPAQPETRTPGVPELRQVIERSLPYLEKGGVAWIEERKCLSCHKVTFMVWGFQETRRAGIAVDARKLDEWSAWSLAHGAKDGKGADGGLDTVVQLLLMNSYARGESAAGNEKAKATLQSLAAEIVKRQAADGTWKPGGQLPAQRRPAVETTAVTAMWAVLALSSVENADEPQKQARQRALDWLKNIKPGISAESLLLHMLVEKDQGHAERAQELLQELLQRQNSDGGWSWLKGEKSDALATGMVLYAFDIMNLKPRHTAIQGAWSFLAQTQRDDGSWYVPTTKKSKKEDNDGMSSYWGTAWAVIGLARTLPR